MKCVFFAISCIEEEQMNGEKRGVKKVIGFFNTPFLRLRGIFLNGAIADIPYVLFAVSENER